MSLPYRSSEEGVGMCGGVTAREHAAITMRRKGGNAKAIEAIAGQELTENDQYATHISSIEQLRRIGGRRLRTDTF